MSSAPSYHASGVQQVVIKAALQTPARPGRGTGDFADTLLLALENRHRWLLFAQHCYACTRSEDACELGKLCTYGKKTLQHVSDCTTRGCLYPRCGLLKPLLTHSRKCESPTCAICVPVRNYILEQEQRVAGKHEHIHHRAEQAGEQARECHALAAGIPGSGLHCT